MVPLTQSLTPFSFVGETTPRYWEARLLGWFEAEGYAMGKIESNWH